MCWDMCIASLMNHLTGEDWNIDFSEGNDF